MLSRITQWRETFLRLNLAIVGIINKQEFIEARSRSRLKTRNGFSHVRAQSAKVVAGGGGGARAR